MITMTKNERDFLETYRSPQTFEHFEFLLIKAKKILTYLKTQTEAQRPVTIGEACFISNSGVTQICQKLMKLKVVERVSLGVKVVTISDYSPFTGNTLNKDIEVEQFGYILTDHNFSFDD
jgi:hypothetical protein